jgi:hypothetical protein
MLALLVVIAAGSAWGLSALSSSPQGGLEFRTIGQADPAGAGPKGATVYIARDAQDVSAFAGFLTPEHQQAVQGVDFSSFVAVAVFRGPVPATGYAIAVRWLSVVNGSLRVEVALSSPAPASYGLPAFSRPYDLVSVSQAQFDGQVPSAWFIVTVEGRVLAAGAS